MNDKKIPLVEVFGPTIQGEGIVIGQQTYFLRFGLCDYKCKMCDSMHAVDPRQVKANAEWLTQDEIFAKLQSVRLEGTTKWVTYSGGNPCIHDLSRLTSLLVDAGWKIAVETQGTFAPSWLYNCDVITCSPKGPGMGERCNLDVLDEFLSACPKQRTNIKVVIFDQRDLEFAKMLWERYVDQGRLPSPPFYLSLGNAYPPGSDFQPEHDTHISWLLGSYHQLLPQIMIDPILSQMRFLPQFHVLLWGNAKGK